MPGYIIKPVIDDDFYVEFSTVTDTIVSYGDRNTFPAERVRRADTEGTSAMYPGADAWHVRDPQGLWFRTEWYPEIPDEAYAAYVPWSQVRAFCATYQDGRFHPTPDLVAGLHRCIDGEAAVWDQAGNPVGFEAIEVPVVWESGATATTTKPPPHCPGADPVADDTKAGR